jgi:hypothetical protein
MVGALFATPSRAVADPPTPRLASLAWVRSAGAESCIGPAALSEAVAKKLGREAIATPSRANLAIEGHIERVSAGGPWRATLAVVSETGQIQGLRELHGAEPDCRTLDESLALVIALLIEPGAILTPEPRLPEAPPSPLATPPPFPAVPLRPVLTSEAPVVEPKPAPSAQRWPFAVGAGVLEGIGLLPGAAFPGIALVARFTPPRWPEIELDAAYWTPRSSGTPGAAFSLGWGSISLCPLVLVAGANELRLCPAVVFAGLVAQTTGLAPTLTTARFVFYPEVTFRYTRRIFGPLMASAGASTLVPTERASFYYLDAAGTRRDVFQQSPIAGTFDLAVGVGFP